MFLNSGEMAADSSRQLGSSWVVQVQEDGSWAIDPSRGDYRTVAAAVVLGVLLPAGLSWLIVPARDPPPVYATMPNSLAVLANDETLMVSLLSGLEQSEELLLVRLDSGEVPDDATALGRSINAATLATGHLSNNGVEIRLLDVAKDDVIWSKSFAWEEGSLPGTSHAIGNGLLEAMGLPDLSRERFIGTHDEVAYGAFASALKHVSDDTPEALLQAIADFEFAVELDDAYTRAYVKLAQTVFELPDDQGDAYEAVADEAVDAVQRLGPGSADAISLLGLRGQNHQLRIQAFERALELDPDHDWTYYRYALQMREAGDSENAEVLIRQALKYRPASARYSAALADILESRN